MPVASRGSAIGKLAVGGHKPVSDKVISDRKSESEDLERNGFSWGVWGRLLRGGNI